MGLRIKTNISSLTSQRHLTNTSNRLSHYMAQLASGKRINRSADDAAGLAISEKMRADISALGQASRNTSDAISLLQVAEGGMVEINNIVVRLKELSIQAASDTIGKKERQFLDREFSQLKDEIDRISNTVEYNGQRLLTGSTILPPELDGFQQGPPLEVQVDKDYFHFLDRLEAKNPVNIIRMDFKDINTLTSGKGSLNIRNPEESTELTVDTKENAQEAVAVLDDAASKVISYRAKLGAIQNRMQHAQNNLGVRIENLSQARSRIMDADIAAASAGYTQENILQQAGISVLAQANQIPSLALKLLQ